MKTNQEIFDAVVTHLATQQRRASNGYECRYRDEAGLKCAVGCLIPDEKYDPKIEGCRVDGYDERARTLQDILRSEGIDLFEKDGTTVWLLSSLQATHDRADDWAVSLRSIAREFNLDASKVPETIPVPPRKYT